MRTILRSVRAGSDEQADSDRYGIEPFAVAEGFDKTNQYVRAMLPMASVVAYCKVVDFDIAD
jgi:hypothetical protein